MTTNALVAISSMEEENIDRDRIYDGHLVPEEYFCPICQYLLWKPRSCSSCQHLFCQKCIQTWIESSNNANKCPFRCQPYEERRCPPYVQSLLSRLYIRCGNSGFGCTQILSYDALEYHENVECQYLSKKCCECEQLVLVSRFNEHREVPGLCIPCPIKCTICQNHIEKSIFRDHFHFCCQNRINEINQTAILLQNVQAILHGQQITQPNPVLTFFQDVTNRTELVEQQKQLSRLPTILKGVDAVRRAREQNCGHIYYILIMLKFILINWRKAPFFIYTFSAGIFFFIGLFLLGICIMFSHWASNHVYIGSLLIILLTYLSSYVTSMIFQMFSDTTIILLFGTLLLLFGCSNRTVSLETLEMEPLFNRTIVSIVCCGIGVFSMKIFLLIIRLYYWLMPTYLTAGLLTLICLYFGFKNYRDNANQAATTNRLTMPV